MKEAVDTLIVIPNDKLLETSGDDTSMLDAFARADEVLCNATRGHFGAHHRNRCGQPRLRRRAQRHAQRRRRLDGHRRRQRHQRRRGSGAQAIHSPLLDDVSIQGATSILVNITGPRSLGIKQISHAATVINSEAGAGAHVFLGTVIDESMPEGEIRVTVIATGFHRPAPAARAAETRRGAAIRERTPVAMARARRPRRFARHRGAS